MAAGTDGVFRIAHLSDLHCGDPHFAPNLLDRAIAEIIQFSTDTLAYEKYTGRIESQVTSRQ